MIPDPILLAVSSIFVSHLPLSSHEPPLSLVSLIGIGRGGGLVRAALPFAFSSLPDLASPFSPLSFSVWDFPPLYKVPSRSPALRRFNIIARSMCCHIRPLETHPDEPAALVRLRCNSWF